MMNLLEKFVEIMGGGKYWTLPFGNEGRGTRVYLWPLTTMGVLILILLFVDHCLQ